jgi:xanthine dehydrogenase YagR molybdenum-binding subunit
MVRLKLKSPAALRMRTKYAGFGTTAYGFIVGSAIAAGRVADIDASAAERMPGVLLIMTRRNAPKQAAYVPYAAAKPFLAGRGGEF